MWRNAQETTDLFKFCKEILDGKLSYFAQETDQTDCKNIMAE